MYRTYFSLFTNIRKLKSKIISTTNVVCDYVMANETPNDADVENCKKLRAALATA